MSELTPMEIAILAQTQSKEVTTPPERFNNALDTFAFKTHTVKPTVTSERYPLRKWVVTNSVSGSELNLEGLSSESFVQLGYPIKDRKTPSEVHIIIDGNFIAPWATIDESNVWQQLIDTTYTDVILSDENQKLADRIVDGINRIYIMGRQNRRRAALRAIGTVTLLGVVAGGVLGGLNYYKSKQEEDAARERAMQQKIAAFDAEWSIKDLTGTPIPADTFAEVTTKQLPADIPTIGLKSGSRGDSSLAFNQSFESNQVRQIRLDRDGCYDIVTDIEEGTTISAATNEKDDSIVVALLDDTNILKICKNGLFTEDKPVDIAIQIHK